MPLFGYRRKSYLALCGVLGTVGGVALATVVDDVPSAAVAFTLGSLSTAFADVVIDGVVVARAREAESPAAGGALQSLCWGSVAFGGILSAYYSGSLIETNGTRFVFGVTAMFPLLIACAAALVREDPARDAEEGTNESKTSPRRAARAFELGTTLWSVGKRRAIWAPALFVFLWQATPNPGTAMFYFQTNELGFQPEFLGRVALARAVAALAGVFLYNAYLKKDAVEEDVLRERRRGRQPRLDAARPRHRPEPRVGHRRPALFPGRLGAAHRPGRDKLSAGVGARGARVPRRRRGDALRRARMSVFNAGGVVSGALGAALTSALGVTSENFDNLFWLVLVCNLSSLAPLAGLGWLDEAPEDDEPGGAPEAPRRA